MGRGSRILLGALTYFALVFAAGFALGIARVLLLVPHVGERDAELLELPVMLALSYLAARLVVRRWSLQGLGQSLACGGLALVMMLGLEFTLVLWLRGLEPGQYLAGRDPLSASAYAVSLVLFALWPAWLSRRNPGREDHQ